MPFNGSGVFALNQNFPADRDAGPPQNTIDADKMDDEFRNIKAGLEAVLTLDGQNSPSQNISWNNKRLTNLANATAGTDALNRNTSDGRYLQISNNLSDVDDVDTARANLQMFPAGTRMLFQQSAAPTGWTKDTTGNLNNTALRIVTGNVGSRTSGDPFTTHFAVNKGTSSAGASTTGATTVVVNSTNLGLSVNNHTLTTAQIPPHRHTLYANVATSGGSEFSTISGSNQAQRQSLSTPDGSEYAIKGTSTDSTLGRSSSVGSGGSHNHGLSGTTGNHNHTTVAHTHLTSNHAHQIDLDVNYHDVTICTRQ